MKIRKFNEDVDTNDTMEFLNNCFVELIDKNFFFKKISDDYIVGEIRVETNGKSDRDTTIKGLIETSKFITEVVNDIDYALEKVLIRYPDMRYKTYFGSGDYGAIIYVYFYPKINN